MIERLASSLTIFSVCVAFRYLCTLGNYVESRYGSPRQRARVLLKHTIHVVVYGIVTTILPVLYFTDVLVYKAQNRTGVDPPIPWPVLTVGDTSWIVCLALTKKFAVPEPPIQISRKILELDEEYEVDEAEVVGLQGRKGQMLHGIRLSDERPIKA